MSSPDSPPEPPHRPVARSAEKQGPAGSSAAGIPELPPSSVSNAIGNIFLLLILVSLVSIPFLVYFTDTGSRAKQEFRKIIRPPEAGGAISPAAARELEQSRQRVAELEREVELLQTRRVAAEETAPRSPDQTAPPPEPVPSPAADITPVPATLPRREYDVATLFNGVGVRTILDLQEGDSATRERVTPESYEFEVKLKLKVPQANTSIAELSALNPNLPQILPALESLLPSARVSPFFDKLYALKHERIKATVTRLDQLETRHNYFDCETILELTHPESGQKALLIQGEMDVVADGSDGDRMPEIDDYISLSKYYQPTTSYGWPKKTQSPNPLLERLKSEAKAVEEEYAVKGLPVDRNRYLVARREELKRLIADLQARSYLIAEADPFIVLPLSMVRHEGETTHRAQIGDHAAVIYGDKVYPAICGDSGPSWKMGEASLFVARTINADAGPYNRPVSDLKVTYVIFPGSRAEKNDAPDLARWTARCAELLNGLGGLGEGFELHQWRDIVAERRAVREGRQYAKDAPNLAASAAQRETKAKEAAAAAAKELSAARDALAKAEKAEPAPEPEALARLREEVASRTTTSEAASASLTAAASARERAAILAGDVTKGLEAIETAAASPYPTPRTQATDIALAKLEEVRKALDELGALAGGT